MSGNKCNGYRPGRTYGHGRTLTFCIPHDRYGNFHPRILAILRDQEEVCERLAGKLYTKGLTQEQVGEVFNDCVHIKIYRKRSVNTEAFYVILAVKEDKTREVLGIYNKPTESALGCGEMLNDLYERGVPRIDLDRTIFPYE